MFGKNNITKLDKSVKTNFEVGLRKADQKVWHLKKKLVLKVWCFSVWSLKQF